MYKDILTQKKFPETALQRFSENCSKFTGEHPRRSVISINMQINFIEIALWHGYSPVNLLHILRTPFLMNFSGGLLLYFRNSVNLLLLWLKLFKNLFPKKKKDVYVRVCFCVFFGCLYIMFMGVYAWFKALELFLITLYKIHVVGLISG